MRRNAPGACWDVPSARSEHFWTAAPTSQHAREWFIDALGFSGGAGVNIRRRAGEIPWRAWIVPVRRRMVPRRARKTPENRSGAGFCGK